MAQVGGRVAVGRRGNELRVLFLLSHAKLLLPPLEGAGLAELLPLPLGAGGAGGVGGRGPVPALDEHGPDVMRHWFVPFWMRM